MNRWLISLVVMGAAGFSGCTSSPVNENLDSEKSAEINAVMGLKYMQNGNYEVALEKLNKALDFDNRYAPAYHYRAELYRRLGEHEKAEDNYRDALYYAKDDNALYENYGVFLCSNGRYTDGVRQLLKVLDDPVYTHSRKGQIYENLGLCYERVPDPEKAEKYLRDALRVTPALSKSLLAMARLQFAKGEYLSTRAYLQRYLENGRHTAQSLWLGIQTERQLGDRNAVSSYGLQLKVNFPGSPETKLYLESGGN